MKCDFLVVVVVVIFVVILVVVVVVVRWSSILSSFIVDWSRLYVYK